MSRVGDSKLLYAMLRRMALDGWVRPALLATDRNSPKRLSEVFRMLRTFCTVGMGDNEGQWRLTDDARRRVFQGWTRADLIRDLEAIPDNAVAASLRWAIGLASSRSETASASEMTNMRAALNWLPTHLKRRDAPDADELTQRIERAAVREDVDLLLGDRFIGRQTQLRRLHALLNEAKTERQVRIAGLWGKGGIGKSTLLAAFHRSLEDMTEPDAIVLRLDFDRPDLNALEPASLDRELIGEIGRAVPGLWEACQSSMHTILEYASESARMLMNTRYDGAYGLNAKVTYSGVQDSDLESSHSVQRSELLEILSRIPRQISSIVLLVDTFERVEAAGPDAVGGVFRWIESTLGTLTVGALIVFAGRHKLEQPYRFGNASIVNLPMKQLSEKDALMLLLKTGCPPELARLLVLHLPVRSPLVLRLAADAIRARADEAPLLFEKLQRGEIPDGLLSAYLYTRILAHIPDPVLRQYAFASLALPELDSGLMEKVLMPQVEPDAADTDLAKERFNALANVHWLIERSGDHLRLRADLRDLVLQVVAGDSEARRRYKRIRSKAYAYHKRHRGRWHEAMALYYRIMEDARNGESAAKLARYTDALREYASELVPFADDLPSNLRLVLSNRLGDQVDLAAAANLLSQEEWRALMDGGATQSGRGQLIVSHENPLMAHRLYMERPTARGALPPAWALNSACDSARWRELHVDYEPACDELLALFNNSDRWSPHLLHLAALLRHSLFMSPYKAPHPLVRLMDQVLPVCAAYGAASSVADLFAIAEVFHKRSYLSPKLLQRLRSGPKTDRILLLNHNAFATQARLTGAAVVRFNEPRSAAAVIMNGSSTTAIERLYAISGQRWSLYQRFYRDLGKSESILGAGRPLIRLPEFYRPLRQAMVEALASDPDALIEFCDRLGYCVPGLPMELQASSLERLAARDAHTWFHAVVQYADWCGLMLEVAGAAGKASKNRSARLSEVIELLAIWQNVLRSRY